MTPAQFISKWSQSDLRERAASQSHFLDLCAMLGETAPTDADPKGEWYAFERGALKTGGGDGWADVWKRGCFAWEYKSPGKDLNAALKQLQYYVRSLENPPILIVSDMATIELHTNWTNTVQEVHALKLTDLADARQREKLKWAFSETEVERLKPGTTREALTKEVAQEFVALANSLRERGHAPDKVAHFVNRMVFCMFAEDVDLLPDKLFKRMLEASLDDPDSFAVNAQQLFAAMARKGGKVGFTQIDWFNGGVFEDDSALPLTRAEIKTALAAANRNWSNIDPSIMGTLFERGLDPGKRSQLGAHYTDPEKIMLIVNPVIVEPLTREWEAKRAEISKKIEQSQTARSPAARTRAFNEANALKIAFIERLKNFRVLDPACGSGNFLYLALKELKNIEHRVNIECEQMGLERGFPIVGPECVKGIEINPFAAELARVSVWIGEIQWMREHGFDASRNPILKPLETIECRDALLNADGSEAEWPEADVIIGNPPFLGRTFLRDGLGDEGIEAIYAAFEDKVSQEVDLVCYWVSKSWDALENGRSTRTGFVTTNSIRSGASRTVLDPIAGAGCIYDAWPDEPWVVDGADVRVSIVCFGETSVPKKLNGRVVERINADLTSRSVDLTTAQPLKQNGAVSFQGITKGGAFEVKRITAEGWLELPVNVNGRPNADVLSPITSGGDIVRRNELGWVIDFDHVRDIEAAAQFEAPFKYIQAHVHPIRTDPARTKREAYRTNWWRFAETRPSIRKWLDSGRPYIATPKVSRHRVFVWLPARILPDNLVIVVLRDDQTSFGLLSSKHHVLWSIAKGAWIGVGNDPTYTPTSSFETFPFPEGLTPDIPAEQYASDPRAKAIAKSAARLNELREAWLNPPDLVKRVPEVVPGYPDRILPIDDNAAAILKKRTLTNLYNERQAGNVAWLDHAHRDLDAAVAAAYGWPADLTDEQILERLFALNQEREAGQ